MHNIITNIVLQSIRLYYLAAGVCCVCGCGVKSAGSLSAWILFNNTPHTNMIDPTLYAYFSINKAS
jgi:hypothetical protein